MQNYISESGDNLKAQTLALTNSSLKMAELNLNMEIFVELIEKIKEVESEIEFLQLILEKAFNLVPEADYGRIVINSQGSAYFLEKIYRKDEIFFSTEKPDDYRNKSNSSEIIFNKRRINKKLTINLKIDSDVPGAVILYISEKSSKVFSDQSVKMVSVLEKISSSYLTIKRYQQLQEKFNQDLVLSLSNLLGIHDQYTKGHNQKVAELSRNLAQALELNKIEIKKAYWSGILHDIGKTLISASILNKKTSLNQQEFSEIKKHPVWAYKILKDSAELNEIAKYVLHHHECWDGSGYPDGLVGEEIPLISRIVSIADAWDAMTSNRSYRKALSQEEAIKRIINSRGKQFSPLIVDVFLDNIS